MPQQREQADSASDERHCAHGVTHLDSMAQAIVKGI